MIKKKKKLVDQITFKEKIFYSLGTLGKESSFAMINVYAMLYLTTFMGLNGIVVGFAFCFIRILSAVFDPFMAVIINNTKSKLGKYKPWMLVGALVNAIMLIALFIPLKEASVGLKYFYYLALYFLWAISYAILDVPSMGIIPSIADKANERESVSSLSKLIGGFGGFLIGSGGAILMEYTYGKLNPISYLVVAGIGSAFLIITIILPIVTLKERYEVPCETVKFSDMFKIYKENTQLKSYTWSVLLFSVGANIAILQSTYLFIYDAKNLGGLDNYALFNIVACTLQGIAMMFYTFITKKLSRDKVFQLTFIFAAIGMLGIFGVYFLFPLVGIPIVNVLIMSAAASFLMIANGMNQITSIVMIADIVDYEEYRSGVRADSLIMSFQTILVKVSAALAMLVLGIGVAVSDLPTIDLMTNTFSGEVTDKSLLILRSFMFLLPLPLMPIGLIIYKKTYSLNGSFYDNMKAELEARRAIKSEGRIGVDEPINTQDYEDGCVKVVDVDFKDIVDSEK